MLVANLIKQLSELPQHLEVVVDVSRGTEPGFVFTIPDAVEVVEDPYGQQWVFIGSYTFTENQTEGLN